MKRREFLAGAAGATSAIALSGTGPAARAEGARGARGANKRVNLALIGCGGRGRHVAERMRREPGCAFTAVCDVYEPHREAARRWAGAGCTAHEDFREVLERRDVDAVLIATPDHWHAIPAVLACRAGKDVYVEKPLAHDVHEGRAVVEAARRADRIVQVGTQQRSAPHFAEARRLVHSGALGRVHYVRIWNFRNRYPEGIGHRPDCDPPPGLNWDLYLGPAPRVPFNPSRFLWTFRFFWDYSGGTITDFGVHRLDSMHQVMGADAPVSVSAAGGRFAIDDDGEVPDLLQATFTYPKFIVSYEACSLSAHGVGGRTRGRKYYGARGADDRPNGLAFYGTSGALFADRLGFEVYPELEPGSLPRRGAPDASAGKGYRTGRLEAAATDATECHARRFVQCVRTRQRPPADAETGHRSTTAAHLANIAFHCGRAVRWEPVKETIPGDPEAAGRLRRPARAPWDLL